MVETSVESIEEVWKEFDLGFNRLQMNHFFFAFEIVFGIYLLLNLGLIAEKFLMPTLMNISKSYGMS
jgi:hypothetical protein